jgi:uncharacterized DUF497 family protein
VYTWTEEKNRENKQKHGFYLSDIVSVFEDMHSIDFYDAEHSSLDEDRYITLAKFNDRVVLFVVTADRNNGDTHIISARRAEPPEERLYNEHYQRQNS